MVNYFIDTIITIRTSCYNDEYRAFFKIKPYHIKSIRISNKYDLIKLKEMLIYMKNYNIQLPVYDYSLESNGVVRKSTRKKY